MRAPVAHSVLVLGRESARPSKNPRGGMKAQIEMSSLSPLSHSSEWAQCLCLGASRKARQDGSIPRQKDGEFPPV